MYGRGFSSAFAICVKTDICSILHVGNYAKTIVLRLLHFKNTRILLCPLGISLRLFFPDGIGLYKSFVDLMFSKNPRPHRFVKTAESSKVKPFPLKSNGNPIFAVFQQTYAAETTGVVTS